MKTLILSREDFKEPEYWIALCDSLGMPESVESISVNVLSIFYSESH